MRSSPRPIALTLTWLLIPLNLSCRAKELDLEQVLARHAEARGGTQALEAVESVRVELRLSEPGSEVDLLYRTQRPDRARVDVKVEGRTVFIEAFDGEVAWQQQGEGETPEVSSPEGTAGLRRSAISNLYGLHELPGLGHRLELLEPTEIEGVLYHVVRLTYDDGGVQHYYIDPESYLVTRSRAVHALHPDVDPTEIWTESRISDYREVDGIVRSFKSTDWDLNTGREVQSVEVRRVELNPSLDSAIFEMPKVGTLPVRESD